MEKALAIYNFDGESIEANELSIKKNDILDVIEKHDGWWKVKNVHGKSGLVPAEYIVAPITEDMQVLSRGKIKEDHEAATDAELAVECGCLVAILENSDDYWWFIGFSGKTGYIPKDKIRVIQRKPTSSENVKQPSEVTPNEEHRESKKKTSTKSEKIRQPFKVAPNKACCKENATVLITFQNKLPEDGQFIVVFKGEHCEKAVDAEKFNEFTLKAKTPQYHPAESTKLIVNHQKTGEAPTAIGKGVKFSFESKIDIVHRLLVTEADPISFLHSSFQIENTQNVDHILSGLLEKRIPEGFNAFKSKQCVTVQNEDHPKETPTLLHFAAFYNLTKLAKTLLECPGAEEALRLQNCHGMVPHALAEFRNHEELAKHLQDSKSAVNQNQDDDDIYQQMENVYERYTKMDEKPARYVTAKLKTSTSSADDGEIYEDMAPSEPELEHYDTPRPDAEDNEEVYDVVDDAKWEQEQATQKKIDEFKVYGRMTEKEVQLALLMKRVKERYITQEQALEMARVLRLEPQVGAPPVVRKPKITKKLSGPVMGELKKKINSALPRTQSTSSGSSMSSVGSNGSGYTSGESDRTLLATSQAMAPSIPEFPKTINRKGAVPPTPVPRKFGHPR